MGPAVAHAGCSAVLASPCHAAGGHARGPPACGGLGGPWLPDPFSRRSHRVPSGVQPRSVEPRASAHRTSSAGIRAASASTACQGGVRVGPARRRLVCLSYQFATRPADRQGLGPKGGGTHECPTSGSARSTARAFRGSSPGHLTEARSAREGEAPRPSNVPARVLRAARDAHALRGTVTNRTAHPRQGLPRRINLRSSLTGMHRAGRRHRSRHG